MAYQIRIAPNALREAGRRMTDVGNQVQDTVSILRAQATRLNMAWDGNAGDRAAETLMHNASSLAPLVQAVEENGRRLQQIAEVFANADKTPAGGIRQMDSGLISAVVRIADRGLGMLSADVSAKNTLSVDPFILRQVSARIDDAADKLWDISHYLRSLGEILSADWEGRAYDRFQRDNQVITDALGKAAVTLRDGAQRIAYAAQRYEQMDADLS